LSSSEKIAFFIGLISVLLGGLWRIQGLGIVQIETIFCFANCVPVQGSSTTWAVIGAVVFAAGCSAIFCSLKSRAN
jgi:hypothetical protein